MDAVREYGLTALPRDLKILLNGAKNNKDPAAVRVSDIQLPDTPLARKVIEYAKSELQEQTFNHSMRVFYYGSRPIYPPAPIHSLTNPVQAKP
jgi:cyanamide hydratase